jgi:hypothetical protein
MAKRAWCGTAMLLLLVWVQAAAALSSEAEDRLKTNVARLYLNHKSLEAVYKGLHDVALDATNGSDQQLSYIQKVYLFVNEANLICFYQWELLAVMAYIKEEQRSDYYTLRVRDLDRSIFESRDRVNSLNLYSAYIENSAARKLIEDAVGLIQANIYLYEDLRDTLKPHANPPNRYNPEL